MPGTKQPSGSLAFLRNYYPVDPITNTVTICISAIGYDGVFNPIDPSPISQRDLSPDFSTYIDDCSNEIPTKLATDIRIHINGEDANPSREEEIRKSIHQSLDFQFRLCADELRVLYSKSLRYSLIAIVCLVLSYTLPEVPHLEIGSRLLVEGFTVGGWVFLWEAIADLFISSEPIKTQRSRLARLNRSVIKFTYDQ